MLGLLTYRVRIFLFVALLFGNVGGTADEVPGVAPPPGDVLKKTVRIVDPNGEPIAGATLIPWAIRTRRGHGTWSPTGYGNSEPPELTSDADGKIDIPFPRHAFLREQLATKALTCRVDHPDFAETMYNDVSVEEGERDRVSDIALRPGAVIEIRSFYRDQLLPAKYIRAVWGSYAPGSRVEVIDEGTVRLPRIVAGQEQLRVAYFPEAGPPRFSDVEQLRLADGERRELRVELQPAVVVNGKLDNSVPRPVSNGRVVVRIIEADAKGRDSLVWSDWADVERDGSFLFSALPRSELQLVAVCDGFMAEAGFPPASAIGRDDAAHPMFGRPQVFAVEGESARITLRMIPTADCRIRVVDRQDRPVAGATCSFWPNVKWWHGGSQIYGGKVHRTRDILADGDKTIRFEGGNRYRGTTDQDGIAVVKNLPPGTQPFRVGHDDYDHGDDAARVELIAGEQAQVTVTVRERRPD